MNASQMYERGTTIYENEDNDELIDRLIRYEPPECTQCKHEQPLTLICVDTRCRENDQRKSESGE